MRVQELRMTSSSPERTRSISAPPSRNSSRISAGNTLPVMRSSAGASRTALKAKAEDTHHPHLAYPLQPRPAPGRPSADRRQGGENWISKRGQCSVPIDTVEFYLGLSPEEERTVFLGLSCDGRPIKRKSRAV